MGNEFRSKLIDSAVGTGLDKLLVFVVPFIAVKLYGVSEFGSFTYFYTIAVILATLAKLGLDQALIYFNPYHGHRYALSSITVVIASSILIMILSLLFYRQFYSFSILVIFLAITPMFFSLHKISGNLKTYYLVNAVIRQGLTVILLFIFKYVDTANGILLAYLLPYILASLIFLIINRQEICGNGLHLGWNVIKFSLPVLLTSSLALIMNQIDIIMIKHYLDANSVGIYTIGAKLATIPSFILMIFDTVFMPRISRYRHEGNVDELKRIYVASARIIGGISLIFLIGLILVQHRLFEIIGIGTTLAGQVVVLRALGQLVNSSVGSVWSLISMSGHPKLNLIGTAVGTILNVGANVVLIPTYGLVGAAVSSSLAIASVNVLGYVLVKRMYSVRVFGFI